MILLKEKNLLPVGPSGSINIGYLFIVSILFTGVLFHYIMPALMVIMKSQNS